MPVVEKEVAQVATPADTTAFAQITVLPSLKVAVPPTGSVPDPVPAVGDTVAVNVTTWFVTDGVAGFVTAVVVSLFAL